MIGRMPFLMCVLILVLGSARATELSASWRSVIVTNLVVPEGNLLTYVAYLAEACRTSDKGAQTKWLIDWSIPDLDIVCEPEAGEDLPELRRWAAQNMTSFYTNTSPLGLRNTGPYRFRDMSVGSLAEIAQAVYDCTFSDAGNSITCHAFPPKLEVRCYQLVFPAWIDVGDLVNAIILIGYRTYGGGDRHVWKMEAKSSEAIYVMAEPSAHDAAMASLVATGRFRLELKQPGWIGVAPVVDAVVSGSDREPAEQKRARIEGVEKGADE